MIFPYLHVTPASLQRTSKLAVGLTWAAGDWNEARSIPFEAMEERDDSPWYPTMRLFRQERQGDWTTAVDRVIHALRSLRISLSSA